MGVGSTLADVERLLKDRAGIRLDIGCGRAKQEGFVGLDRRDLPGVDIVWDVCQFPWPLPDECVLTAFASHLVEHIPPVAINCVGGTWFPFMRFMDEVWRVLRPDGEFAISCPHANSTGQHQDPTHCASFVEATWAYFDPLEESTGGILYRIYRPKPWRIKFLSWAPNANMEVVLVKRREDRSYND